MWVVATPRDANRAARRECRERYARAATRADTAAVDLHPVAVRKHGPLYCYKFRFNPAW